MSSAICRPKPLVLKFGGALLGQQGGVERAAACVQRERAGQPGAGVVVVVSALGATTDRLFDEAARRFGDDEAAVADHVSSGEEEAAQRMVAALEGLGAPVLACSPECLQLVTTGSLLDGEPESVNADGLQMELYPAGGEPSVVVTMGFVALDGAGRRSLLGRGGSDLTALFVAHHLDACDCVLLKDVDGIHESDPKATEQGAPARLDEVALQDLERFGGRVLQSKAARFAARTGRPFSLGSPERPGLRTRVR
ncbi:MAG: hypothetical protein P8M11_05215 [Planctomycetota bacterium]|nr:hypothetical protein [Planctomycetota bacterium]MDG1983945.1 hypothetical protein [Planctomycetota bacterium]